MPRHARALRTALCFMHCALSASVLIAAETGNGDWTAHCHSAPRSVAVDASGRIFIASTASNQILAYDPETAVVDRWQLATGTLPRTLAVASGKIYFAAIGSAIGALEPATGRIERFAMQAPSTPYWIAAAPSGLIWFSDPGAMRLASFEPSSGALREFPVSAAPYAIAIDARARVWVTLPEAGELGVLNPRTGLMQRIRLGSGTQPRGIATSRDAVWVILAERGTLLRLEGPRARDTAEYRPPRQFGPPLGLAVDPEGAIWVTFRDTAHLWRIDASSRAPQTVQAGAGLAATPYQESSGVRSCAADRSSSDGAL